LRALIVIVLLLYIVVCMVIGPARMDFFLSRSKGGKTYGEIPVLPIRGENTLYSPQYVELHYKNNPTLWTEQSANTWTAGSIRLGRRWKTGGNLLGLDAQFLESSIFLLSGILRVDVLFLDQKISRWVITGFIGTNIRKAQ